MVWKDALYIIDIYGKTFTINVGSLMNFSTCFAHCVARVRSLCAMGSGTVVAGTWWAVADLTDLPRHVSGLDPPPRALPAALPSAEPPSHPQTSRDCLPDARPAGPGWGRG